uniref:Cystatin domain-containing protein n=1 Tax=Loa loa TaxID=7209 RepID=A0A1I7VG21_LOALO
MDQMKNIRQSFLIGGKHDVEEIDNTKYKDMSWRALMKMNEASNDEYHWIPVKILRITTQIVAGVKISLMFL